MKMERRRLACSRVAYSKRNACAPIYVGIMSHQDRKLRVAYAIQNVGIELSQQVGDAVPVKHTLQGLARAGHDVCLLRLKKRDVLAVDDMVTLNGRRRLPLNLTGKRPFLIFESGVRRLQRELGLPYFALFDSFRFYEACRNILEGYDVCHEHNGLFSIGAAWACRRLGIPYVLTVSADPLIELKFIGKPLRGFHARAAARAARFTYEVADKILCVSEPAKKHLVDNWGVAPEKIQVMPNGVDVAAFGRDFDSTAIRQAFDLADELVVMFVGGFQLWHGIDQLIESFALVLPKVPNARLFLVGDGPARSRVEQKITALGISQAVRITGMMAHEHIPEILSIADVTAVPYPQLPQELWFSPLKLYEYMAAGKAIVASKSGQIATVLQHGQNGLLVEPGNTRALAEAITALLSDAAERARLGENARRQAAANHSWQHYVQQLEDIYCHVL